MARIYGRGLDAEKAPVQRLVQDTQHTQAETYRQGGASPTLLPALEPANLLSLQRAVGNSAVGQLLAPVQRKADLTLGAARDPLEQEADRVADTIVRGGEASPLSQVSGGQEATGELPPDTALLSRALESPAGHGLPADTRARMEAGFGRDFGDVRIHTGSVSAQAAVSIGAQAFTSGRDIHFAEGMFTPGTQAGEHLIAHELAHTVQQSSGGPVQARRVQRDMPDGAAPEVGNSQPADLLDKDIKKAIVSGQYADKGDYAIKTQTHTVKETVTRWKLGREYKTELEKEVKTVESTFTETALEKAKQYLDRHWAPTIDMNKATGGSGDTKGKHIEMPDWVYEYQNKLAAQKPRDYVAKSWEKGNNPNWNEDSVLAQRVLEAFLRSWHRKQNPDSKSVPSNIEELYKRSGVSEKAHGNAQAELLGDPNIYGWCGPATYNAVVLGLLKNGLRFDTGKDPVTGEVIAKRKGGKEAQFIKNSIKWKNKGITDDELNRRYELALARMAFLEEVGLQAAFFIGNNTQEKKGWLTKDRFVQGEEAYANYHLKPGDVITQALMNGSPVSGHVLTVIKEDRDPSFAGEPGTVVSTIYAISGNAGSIGGGSVRSEKFSREMPPATLKNDLGKMESLGNRGTAAKADRTSAEKKETDRIAKEKGIAAHKVDKGEVAKAADAHQAGKKAALQADLAAAEAQFQAKAGMTYDGFLQEKAKKPRPASNYKAGVENKDLIGKINSLRGQIRVIDDYGKVPVESAAAGVPYLTEGELYKKPSGKTGRFRPELIGNMWITRIIKAGESANAHKINEELNASPEEREKKISEAGWDKNLSEAEYREKLLTKYGMKRLPGSVESMWPGAMEAIEGKW